MHTIAHAHAGGPSCLRADDTNKGCWRFDSTRQAAAAQQGRPFTACQPAPLQEPLTKSHRMWDSQRDDGDTVTSNLRHAGMQKDKHTHTNIHPCHPLPSLLAAGQQLACPIVSHTDETAQLCPNSVSSLLYEPPKALTFLIESAQRAVFLWYQSSFWLHQQRQKITRRNQIIPTVIYTDLWWFHKKALQGGIYLTGFLKLTDYHVL